MVMPCCEGWTFRVEQLARQDLASIPVVVMTATYETHREANKLQAAAILPKPFELDRLLATVEHLAR